jgi:hypothetical protein
MQQILTKGIVYIWTAEHVLTGMVTTSNAFVTNYSLCNELLYIINSDLYTVSMTLFGSTEHNVTCALVIYIWTLILWHSFSRSLHLDSVFTVEHVLTRMVTHFILCNDLLYKICFDLYAVYVTRFVATLHNLTISYDIYSLHVDC